MKSRHIRDLVRVLTHPTGRTLDSRAVQADQGEGEAKRQGLKRYNRALARFQPSTRSRVRPKTVPQGARAQLKAGKGGLTTAASS